MLFRSADSQADPIDNRGRIVGWALSAGGEQHAFLWSSGRMVDLNSLVSAGPEAVLTEATAISDAWQIVANGSDGRAYLITVLIRDHTVKAAHPVGQKIVDARGFDRALAAPGELEGVSLPEEIGGHAVFDRLRLASLVRTAGRILAAGERVGRRYFVLSLANSGESPNQTLHPNSNSRMRAWSAATISFKNAIWATSPAGSARVSRSWMYRRTVPATR